MHNKLFKIVTLLIVLYLVSGVPGQGLGHQDKYSFGHLGEECDTSAWDKYVGPFLKVEHEMETLPTELQSQGLKVEYQNLKRMLNEFKKENNNNRKLCNEDPKFQCIRNSCNCRDDPAPHNFIEVNGICLSRRGGICQNHSDCANPSEDHCSEGYCEGFAFAEYLQESTLTPAMAGVTQTSSSYVGLGIALLLITLARIM